MFHFHPYSHKSALFSTKGKRIFILFVASFLFLLTLLYATTEKVSPSSYMRRSLSSRLFTPKNPFSPKNPLRPLFSSRFLTTMGANGFFFFFDENRFHDVIQKSNANAPLVGVFLPFSGNLAPIAKQLEKTILMVYYRKSRPFNLRFYDTGGDSASKSASQAKGDGISLAIGPLTKGSTRKIQSALSNDIPILSFSNLEDELKDEHTFAFGISPKKSVRRVFEYLKSRNKSGHHIKKMALLYDTSDWGDNVRDEVKKAAKEADIEITIEQELSSGDSKDELYEEISKIALFEDRKKDLIDRKNLLKSRGGLANRIELLRLKDKKTMGDVPYDALFVGLNGELLRLAASLIPYYDIDTEKTLMVGTEQWSFDWVADEPAFWGGLYAYISRKGVKEFNTTYHRRYGADPNFLSAIAYDAARTASWAIEKSFETIKKAPSSENSDNAEAQQIAFRQEILKNLKTPGGFRGTRGAFKLLDDGTVLEKMPVYKLQRKSSVAVFEGQALDKKHKPIILAH